MTMEKVISYINTNRGNSQKSSLDRLFRLLEHLGNPQKGLKYIHITGTNGKGSTTALFSSVLQEANLQVGIFTSPHLEVVNERIRINGKMIEDNDLIRIVNHIEPVVIELEAEMGVKFYAFELLTTVAFIYFQEQQPDIVLLEAGIGGRLDSTNVTEDPLLTVITSIGIDHMSTLGHTKEEILYEKSQILKENGHMIVGPIEENLKDIVHVRANEVNGSVSFVDRSAIDIKESLPTKQTFNYGNWQEVTLTLLGHHQIENACLVLEAFDTLVAHRYPISRKQVYRGLEKAQWPGRFEKVSDAPLFYMDGAHNEASVKRLVETLEVTFPNKQFYFVIGMMKDKAYEEMIKQVEHLAKMYILVSPDPNRGFNSEEVANDLITRGFKAMVMPNMMNVLNYVQNEIPKDDIVIQFGSLYLVGELKQALKE